MPKVGRIFGVLIMLWAAACVPAEPQVLNVCNWNDYIAQDTIPAFERATGIRCSIRP